MKINQWGEDVWEDKIKTQDETGVIGGDRVSYEKVREGTRNNLAFLKKYFLNKISPSGKVLDCGMGPLADYSIFFAKHGYDVTGIDVSKTTLNYAKKNIEKSGCKIKLIHDNFAEFKNTSGQYDVVFCNGVFLHIPSYLALETIRKFYAKTKRGGYCIIEFSISREPTIYHIFFRFFYQLAHKIKGIFSKTFNVNCSEYTPENILDMIEKSGFKLKYVRGNHYLLEKK